MENVSSFLYKRQEKKSIMTSYRKKHTLKERQEESKRIRKKFPNRIPVLINKSIRKNESHQEKEKSKTTNQAKKYLVPGDFTMGQFSYVFRKKMKMKPEEAIYFYVSERWTMCPNSAIMSQMYKEYQDPDGFLYLDWKKENTFGCD